MESPNPFYEECLVLDDNNYELCGWELSYHGEGWGSRTNRRIAMLEHKGIKKIFIATSRHSEDNAKYNVFYDINCYLRDKKIKINYNSKFLKEFNIV